ncbi:glycosyltransferase family 39 protein [Tahibacter caeni]|uniref:glycosyltransferase family 39 protein n=1 Tax=Tahibacter caeni TaxID=1453545 RepID=UPI00214982BA|nr:glycosyltransferase family 39 protein [Tahibacter caeni]
MTAQSAAPPATAAAAPVWHWALLCGLVLLQAWTAAGMAGTPDTLRDMYFAQQLARGEHWPLAGPVIYNTLHLGPLWYYLLGAAMWLLPHPLTVPVLTAALAGLKYPLAYVIGRRYGGARLGLLFALAFFAPGWSSFILAAMTHTTVVETAVLFGLWCTLHYRDAPSAPRALLLGLGGTVMFHAHPTTLLLGCLLVVYALAAAPTFAVRLRDAALIAAVGLASLAPMLIEQLQGGFADLGTITNYANRDPALPALSRLGALLLSVAGYGAEYTLRYWLELPAVTRRAAMLLHLLALTACAVLALSAPQRERRRIAATMLVLLPLQSLFVLALRPITPYWMVFAHLPLVAVLVALGLDRACDLGRAARAAVAALATSWCAWSIAIHVSLSHPPEQALVAVADPARHGLMNVTYRLTKGERHTILLLALNDRYAITAPLCEPATLYAHYAEFIDQSLGVGLLARCGRKDQIRIGGPPAGRALIGLRDHAWRDIGAEPQQRIAHLGYSAISGVLQAGTPSPPAVAGMFPAHPDLPVAPQDFVVEGSSAPGEFVAVAHRAAFHEPFGVALAAADGAPMPALYRDHMTAIFRAPSGTTGPVRWEIRVHATPAHVDVVSFADAKTR